MTDAPVVNGRTFDRIPHWDENNDRFPVKMFVEAPVPLPTSKSHARTTWLNQGSEGGCTGFSDATILSMSPHAHKDVNAGNAEWLYAQAKAYDEFPGVNYTGSSVLGAQKADLAFKLTTSYLWAKTIDDICHAIAFGGPVQFGINWYDSMFHVDSEGIIRIDPGASIAGGHAICGGAYKTTASGSILIRLDNTWGKSWGKSGSAWIADTDIERLLSEDGECAMPVKANPLGMLGTSGRVDPPGAS